MAESVSRWIKGLKTGDESAVRELWLSYFGKLVSLARKHLRGTNRSFADEEDVALSAFDSFCRAAEDDRFPQLNDRQDLWQLLVLITQRKTRDLHEYHSRQRRDTRLTQSLAADGSDAGMAPQSRETAPDFAAEMAEQVEHLLELLKSDDLRRVALWKMEGYTNGEIAAQFGCVERTIERKLWIIKQVWGAEVEDDE
jgi:DNA-directed RNA polymerase specialized sigma24 family protein